MAEAKEFENISDMKEYIVSKWLKALGVELFSTEDIVIDGEAANDERNGWRDTRYVCVKRMGMEDYMVKYGCPQCIGMCATQYPGNAKRNE